MMVLWSSRKKLLLAITRNHILGTNYSRTSISFREGFCEFGTMSGGDQKEVSRLAPTTSDNHLVATKLQLHGEADCLHALKRKCHHIQQQGRIHPVGLKHSAIV